jgi:hypothetical protein
MNTRAWSILVVACLALSACQDRRNPVKPTTGGAASGAAAVAIIQQR